MSSDIPASPASLRDSISLLTGLLQGVSPSHSSERLTENVSRPWENLQSVTTLLTTGDPVEDPNGDSVVAATYSTGPNGIEALLVKNTRPSDVHNTLIAPQVTRLIDTPLDDNQVEELLRKWWVLRYGRLAHSFYRPVSEIDQARGPRTEPFPLFKLLH